MAKFKGEIKLQSFIQRFRSSPVGFGMTNAIIYHHCATEIGIRCPWSRVDKKYKKDPRFKVELTSKKVLIEKSNKIQIKIIKKGLMRRKSSLIPIDYESLSLFREMMADRFKTYDDE